jgi:hypothetical protein
MQGMSDISTTSRERLTALRLPLLDLHRALLESERRLYELAHGRVTPGELLTLALKHQQFAWLHPLSALIVRIDELLMTDEEPTEVDVSAIVTDVKARLTPAESGSFIEQRYDRAIQNDPAVLLAHRAVMQALSRTDA